MIGHPKLGGEGRDVTALMRAVLGLLAKDGFEGVQLVALADGHTIAVKISDGGDRARMPVAAEALRLQGVQRQALAVLRSRLAVPPQPPILANSKDF